ncbi:acyltransferase [Demequina capsici]|uniref:Acyltransferase n=1 Tax=Demequina capsici TaxID=3075620 RepID=A0AA96FCE9_9MICO|nr:acyltransferase [Demequina sp. PMTSA13]WNM27804.1 acyltransferase [Demequina sp. PMTSA13]
MVLGRSRLTVGRSVALADGVMIDARSKRGVVLGDSVTIDRSAILRGSGTVRQFGEGIRVGERTAIGFANLLHGGGGIEIGRDCLLGPNVVIMSEQHRFERGTTIREQPGAPAPVRLGDDVWIGAGVTILAGVAIGSRSVVGAGSVVTKDIPEDSVAFGTPAQVVRRR